MRKLNPKSLKNLKPGNHGGGRPPSEFRERARLAFENGDILQFFADVAAGKDFEQKINEAGEVIKIPASIRDRLVAGEKLKDWGYGKDIQPVEVQGRFIIICDGENETIEGD